MIRVEQDPAFINRIVNSASVRPFVDYSGTDGLLDMTPAVGRAPLTGIVWLSNGEDALAAMEQTGDRDYKVHLFFDATCRGRKALDTAKRMVERAANFTDMMWGEIPLRNKGAMWFAHRLGFVTIEQNDASAIGPCMVVARRIH